MSKLNTDARLPQSDDMRALKQRLGDLQRETATQVNAMADGAISGCTNAAPAAPSGGTYARGDFVRNSAPAELGTAGSKYVVFGWLCLAAPSTFVPMRFLTGN
jgi:hypothetical protein